MPAFDLSQLFLPQYEMASLTYWNRLDSFPRSREVGRGLKAEVRDAMWMLTRQWQFGEFKGEDAGSPVSAKVSGRHITPSSVTVNQQSVPYDLSVPIEAIAEREEIMPSLRLRVQMGKMFLRLLKVNNLANRSGFFNTQFPLSAPDDEEIKTTQFFAAVTRRVPDGFDILKKARVNPDSFFTGIPGVPLNATEIKTVTDIVLVEFIQWYDQLYFQVPRSETAWLPERMEYSFRVNIAQGGGATSSLNAAEYPGGRLDWSDFDLQVSTGGSTTTNPPVIVSEEKGDVFLPSIVSYRGMPNPRFWQMEEGTMDYGKIEQSPAGVVGLLLAEYGLTYSNDWFLLPWPVRTNTICGMQGILVNDVFGQRNFVAPASMTP
ncbi:MAG TPA: hypothetical protein VK666_00010, partial [Chryseolinea sp.]|nr:hypothetical protein [Chryseolinea sp.]